MTPGSNGGPSKIIKPEHLPLINNALDTIKQLQNEINLAKMAGLDTSIPQAKLDATSAQLKGIKQVYFPGQ